MTRCAEMTGNSLVPARGVPCSLVQFGKPRRHVIMHRSQWLPVSAQRHIEIVAGQQRRSPFNFHASALFGCFAITFCLMRRQRSPSRSQSLATTPPKFTGATRMGVSSVALRVSSNTGLHDHIRIEPNFPCSQISALLIAVHSGADLAVQVKRSVQQRRRRASLCRQSRAEVIGVNQPSDDSALCSRPSTE